MMSDEQLYATLAEALPRVSPPDDLFERILAAAVPEPVTAPRVRARPQRRWWPTAAAAGLAAAAAAAITVAVYPTKTVGHASASAVLSAPTTLTGRAELFRAAEPGGELRLSLNGVPAPRAGTHYEIWLLPADSTQMTAVGSFTPARRAVSVVVPLPTPGQYRAIDISVQTDNGPATRSKRTLVTGFFRQET